MEPAGVWCVACGVRCVGFGVRWVVCGAWFVVCVGIAKIPKVEYARVCVLRGDRALENPTSMLLGVRNCRTDLFKQEWGSFVWVGLVGGVRDALVVVHLNRSGSMPTSYYYYDSSLGGVRDALVVVQLSRSGSSVDKRRSSTSKNEVLSKSSAPPGSWRGSWGV